MSYVLVGPLFLLWLLLAGAAVAAARSLPSLAGAYYYVWRIALWATLGVIAANAALFAVMTQLPAPPNDGRFWSAIWGLFDAAGPLIVSPLGWLAGALAGVVLSLLHERSIA